MSKSLEYLTNNLYCEKVTTHVKYSYLTCCIVLFVNLVIHVLKTAIYSICSLSIAQWQLGSVLNYDTIVNVINRSRCSVLTASDMSGFRHQ